MRGYLKYMRALLITLILLLLLSCSPKSTIRANPENTQEQKEPTIKVTEVVIEKEIATPIPSDMETIYRTYIWSNSDGNTINFNGEIESLQFILDDQITSINVSSIKTEDGNIPLTAGCFGNPNEIIVGWGYRGKDVGNPPESMDIDTMSLWAHSGSCRKVPAPLEALREAIEGNRYGASWALEKRRKENIPRIIENGYIGFNNLVYFKIKGIEYKNLEKINNIDKQVIQNCINSCNQDTSEECNCTAYIEWFDRFFPNIETPNRVIFAQTCGANGKGDLETKYFIMLELDPYFKPPKQ